MALYFNLGLVARTMEDAEACATFFRARALVLDDSPVPLEVYVHARRTDVLVGVWPRGMSYASPKGDDRRLTTDAARETIARWFDATLIDAPPFAAAAFGGEMYDYFLDDEPLVEQLGQGFGGLYVDDALWNALDRPLAAVRVGPARHAWPRTGGV